MSDRLPPQLVAHQNLIQLVRYFRDFLKTPDSELKQMVSEILATLAIDEILFGERKPADSKKCPR